MNSHGLWVAVNTILAIACLGMGAITFVSGRYQLGIWQLCTGLALVLAALYRATIRDLERR
jgi:hypothetical protein